MRRAQLSSFDLPRWGLSPAKPRDSSGRGQKIKPCGFSMNLWENVYWIMKTNSSKRWKRKSGSFWLMSHLLTFPAKSIYIKLVAQQDKKQRAFEDKTLNWDEVSSDESGRMLIFLLSARHVWKWTIDNRGVTCRNWRKTPVLGMILGKSGGLVWTEAWGWQKRGWQFDD